MLTQGWYNLISYAYHVQRFSFVLHVLYVNFIGVEINKCGRILRSGKLIMCEPPLLC